MYGHDHVGNQRCCRISDDCREASRNSFWDTYFDIVEILPGIEDAYATFYQVDPI